MRTSSTLRASERPSRPLEAGSGGLRLSRPRGSRHVWGTHPVHVGEHRCPVWHGPHPCTRCCRSQLPSSRTDVSQTLPGVPVLSPRLGAQADVPTTLDVTSGRGKVSASLGPSRVQAQKDPTPGELPTRSRCLRVVTRRTWLRKKVPDCGVHGAGQRVPAHVTRQEGQSRVRLIMGGRILGGR